MKALALFSGGLDSILAVRVIQAQGVEVVGVHFFHRFHRPGQPGSWPDSSLPSSVRQVKETARSLGMELVCYDFSQEFISMVNKPKFGRGKALNPCVDCRITMLSLARRMMPTVGASFVVTGEVLGQRPMTQVRHRLNFIAKHSGLGRILVRPLSAKRLTPTIPEERGWLDRSQLLDLVGRGRRSQMALAARFGITSFPQPAGGCFLTDPTVAARFFAWLDKLGTVGPRELVSFRTGRHFLLPSGNYVVAGRDARENEALAHLFTEAMVFVTKDRPGSSVFLLHDPKPGDVETAAAIAARYSKFRDEDQVTVVGAGRGHQVELTVRPLPQDVLDSLRL